MTPKEKEEQLKEWSNRNKHVLEVSEEVRGTVSNLIGNGYTKADILLYGELMIDLAKRFD
jgi:hypothetical protein